MIFPIMCYKSSQKISIVSEKMYLLKKQYKRIVFQSFFIFQIVLFIIKRELVTCAHCRVLAQSIKSRYGLVKMKFTWRLALPTWHLLGEFDRNWYKIVRNESILDIYLFINEQIFMKFIKSLKISAKYLLTNFVKNWSKFAKGVIEFLFFFCIFVFKK